MITPTFFDPRGSFVYEQSRSSAPELLGGISSVKHDGGSVGLFKKTGGGISVAKDGDFIKPAPYRPDRAGGHRYEFERNRKIIYATQTHCAICGQPVDFSLKAPDPMAPSVDHIIPVAKGGHPSALENLQLAHLRCNRAKGTRLKEPKAPAPVSNRSLVLSADWTTF